jgi:hypothetical protein
MRLKVILKLDGLASFTSAVTRRLSCRLSTSHRCRMENHLGTTVRTVASPIVRLVCPGLDLKHEASYVLPRYANRLETSCNAPGWAGPGENGKYQVGVRSLKHR